MRARSPLAAIAALTAMLALLAAGTPARAVDKTVKMRDNFFTPVFIVITVGDSVTWINDGTDRHTVTSFAGGTKDFDSSPETDSVCDDGNPLTEEGRDCVRPGGSYAERFDEPGTYNYYCKAHGNQSARPTGVGAQEQPCGMCGQVVVQREAEPPRVTNRPTTRPTTSASATVSASASPTASASTSLDPNGSPIAAPDAGGGGGAGRTLLALLLIACLSGAGYWTWKRYLAPR